MALAVSQLCSLVPTFPTKSAVFLCHGSTQIAESPDSTLPGGTMKRGFAIAREIARVPQRVPVEENFAELQQPTANCQVPSAPEN